MNPAGNQAVNRPSAADGAVDDDQQGDEDIAPSAPPALALPGRRARAPSLARMPAAPVAAPHCQVADDDEEHDADEGPHGGHDDGRHERTEAEGEMAAMLILQVPSSDC